MYKNIFISLLFLVGACTAPSANKTSTVAVTDTSQTPTASNLRTAAPNTNDFKKQLPGNWTDGTSEDATIMVSADSILYISHLDKYKYQVQNDSIKIYFTDKVFAAKMFFKGDTLLWFSKTDTTKLWAF
jgi:hypothetical protein